MRKANRASGDKLTTGQAARLLGISPQYVRILAEQGRLAFEDTPLGRLYPIASVERLRKDREAA